MGCEPSKQIQVGKTVRLTRIKMLERVSKSAGKHQTPAKVGIIICQSKLRELLNQYPHSIRLCWNKHRFSIKVQTIRYLLRSHYIPSEVYVTLTLEQYGLMVRLEEKFDTLLLEESLFILK